ncbi:hypothetical protein AB5N19_12407 [Seiridium cardinale]|uniref:UDP-glucuronate decarboxylase n=1 Tax=Seiridium cardinale TaxID=138064 RepID=A0ABR2XTC0_9PEZI
MCVVVTGGAGFIGSHLVDHLLQQGKRVVVIDSLWTGSLENVEKFKGNENYRFIKHDVRDSLPMIKGATDIYHLACPASPDHFEGSAIEILETCFKGTQNMLELAACNKAKILIASTSEIYGDPKVIPQSEKYWGNTNSFGPRCCYDEGKRITEALAYGYQLRYGVEVRIARIFNTYGPSMQIDDGRAIPNFIVAAMKGRPIQIYGDGSATRCFQYVSDLVAGLSTLMKSDYASPVNIGTELETPVADIAGLISELVAGKMGNVDKVSIQYLPARQDDPHRRKPDTSLARDSLHWKPQVALIDGLSATIDWFLSRESSQNL